ncbi:hypothetical protein PV379_03080 [Streptomyces caniscabiei]|uniref:aldose epimerase family protein n=1 Tax=Streptomyces caniscabiei TaxID=2746961 RepID=UPI0029B1D39B|nr:hypothetical protein [Streptomyces caniscabiei]MDX2776327.1 hypothetical protein [Streptomyces caniscabiei]
MEIELFKGETKAIIDPQGAWLTNLSDQRGDILFPKRTLQAPDGSKKVRGGSHVCLPNFGSGGESGLPQHGFGRTMRWTVSEQDDASVTLLLEKGEGMYEALGSTLTYELHANQITMTLEVANGGQQPLRIAPAFHPYIAAPRGAKEVMIDNESVELDELSEAQFVTAEKQTVMTSQRTVTLKSKRLTTWARWTDQLGPYVCVEPTLGGFTFLNDIPRDDELLDAGGVKTYQTVISW